MYVSNFCELFIFLTGRKSLYSKHDVRVSDARKTVFYFGPDEWWGSALSSVTTWSFQWARGSVLCLWSHFGTGAHAQSICRLQRLKGERLTTTKQWKNSIFSYSKVREANGNLLYPPPPLFLKKREHNLLQ